MTTNLTNDQITAGAAVLCDHGQPIGRNAAIAVFDAMQADTPAAFAKRYSELVCENALLKKQLAETKPKCPTCKGNDTTAPCAYPGSGMDGCLRDKRLAPSPQIAEKVELPKPWAQRFNEGEFTSVALAKDAEIAELRNAIAASRRAAGDAIGFIGKESANALQDGSAYGICPAIMRCADDVLDAVPVYLATPAPASAGQAGRVATCTCPSGDGSLRWPCPQHPPESPTERAAAPEDQPSAQKGGA